METAIVADRLDQSIFVMPGLVPGIHAFLQRRWVQQSQDVDGRVKPGHDEFSA
jgi:hypothetical protein